MIHDGGFIALLVLLPNTLMVFFHPTDRPVGNLSTLKLVKWLEMVERIGQVSCFILPIFYSVHFSSSLERITLILGVLFLLVYYFCWGRYIYYKNGFSWLFAPLLGIPLPMAIAPILVFLCAAINFQSIWLGIAVCVLALGHIPVSWFEYKRGQTK
jgi:hypothetical protein